MFSFLCGWVGLFVSGVSLVLVSARSWLELLLWVLDSAVSFRDLWELGLGFVSHVRVVGLPCVGDIAAAGADLLIRLCGLRAHVCAGLEFVFCRA